MTTDLSNEAGDRDEQAALWCVELSSGALTPEQSKAFDVWIASAGNAAALQEAADAWRKIDALSETPEFVAMRAASLERFRKQNKRRWAAAPDRRRWLAIAASVVTVALVSVTMLTITPRTKAYETAVGERQTAVLADGSTISLDADSRVDVLFNNQRRELILVRGRAKFDVARDALRPFTVDADGQTIVATGTAFSVEKVGGDVQVLLYHGSVSVIDRAPIAPGRPAGLRETILSAGEAVTLSSRQDVASVPEVRPFPVGTSIGWEKGALAFDDEPLAVAVERMNRYSDHVVVPANEEVGALRVTGVFRAGDTAAFVEGVTALHGLRPVESGRQITLVKG
jgi:transmembrane sensor